MEEQNEFFHILSFSMFSDVKGPVPVYCYPQSVEETIQVEIAMKSVSLLMGEAVYQAGLSDDLKYFGILPFPDLNYIGLTYFFLIPDEQARGKSKAATITFVVKETSHDFIYDNIHTLRILLDKARVKLRSNHQYVEIQNILDDLRNKIVKIYQPAHLIPQSHLKIVFAGLDDSGKTSFLKTVKNEFSELMGISPTVGIARSERELSLGITAVEWDFGGQEPYRDNYFENATVYLNDVDLLFYFIDVQNLERIKESLTYLSRIIHTLENFKRSPLIQIALHKFDPDLEFSPAQKQMIAGIQDTLYKLHSSWDLKIHYTSIFNSSSIKKCFSYGFSRLSPNQSLFTSYLKKFVQKIDGNVAFILTKNTLVLGQYSNNIDHLEYIEDIRNDLYELFRNRDDLSIPEPFQSIEIDGTTLIFYSFLIESFEFFLLFDSTQNQKKVEKIVKNLKRQISPLIRNYLN
jgi:hypothetical protein